MVEYTALRFINSTKIPCQECPDGASIYYEWQEKGQTKGTYYCSDCASELSIEVSGFLALQKKG